MLQHLENIVRSDPKLQKASVNYEGVSSHHWFTKYLDFRSSDFIIHLVILFNMLRFFYLLL